MRPEDTQGSRNYLTEEAKESLTSLLEAHPEFSKEAVQAVFQEECKKFEELFRADTPKSAIQRVALNQTKKRLRDGEIPGNSDN